MYDSQGQILVLAFRSKSLNVSSYSLFARKRMWAFSAVVLTVRARCTCVHTFHGESPTSGEDPFTRLQGTRLNRNRIFFNLNRNWILESKLDILQFVLKMSCLCPDIRAIKLSSYTKVYSVIYDSGSDPEQSIFSPRETSPESITRGVLSGTPNPGTC